MNIDKHTKKVGLLFGSFNPVHNGHIELAQEALKTGNIDELWFVVSPHNPHKNHSDLAPFDDRIAMVRLAAGNDPAMLVSDVENGLPLPSYTYMTLRKLREENPHVQFVLVVGGDVIERIPTWKEYQEIISHHDFMARVRADGVASIPDGVRVTIIPGKRKISATEIRSALASGIETDCLCSEVKEYIREKGLY